MKKFKDIQAVEEWLEPMDYEGFWFAVTSYGIDGVVRAHCDKQIQQGASKETVLEVMKALVRIELTESLNLKRRTIAPWLKLVETH